MLSVTYPFADHPFSVFGSGDKVLRRTLIWIVLGQGKRETNDDRPKLVIPCWPAALFIYNLRLTSFLGSNCIDWDRLGLCLALELKGCSRTAVDFDHIRMIKWVGVCVFLCVSERETERVRERETERRVMYR